jgi:hypothetical protein
VAYIAVVPPIRFINVTSSVGTATSQQWTTCRNNPDDVLIVRAFMIYLQNFRGDLPFTNTRLTRLSGSLDADLSQMILDYKTFKTKANPAAFAPEERGNDRVLTQNLHLAVPSASSALQQNIIMSLNLDVKPLSGYGDNTVDVMCNLFPIRSKLTVPTLTGSGLWDKVRDPDLSSRNWRDLARNKVPWNQWLRAHQEAALNEYALARDRKAEVDADPTKMLPIYLPIRYDEDDEVFALLGPYQNEVTSFREHHTEVALSTSPNPSVSGQPLTVNISVTSRGGQAPQGVVKLWIVSRELMRFYGRSTFLTPSKAFELRLQNGSATFNVSADQIFTGKYFVRADYWPTGGFLESTANMEHEVK